MNTTVSPAIAGQIAHGTPFISFEEVCKAIGTEITDPEENTKLWQRFQIERLTVAGKIEAAELRGVTFDKSVLKDAGFDEYLRWLEWGDPDDVMEALIHLEKTCVQLLMKHDPLGVPDLFRVLQRAEKLRYRTHVMSLLCALSIMAAINAGIFDNRDLSDSGPSSYLEHPKVQRASRLLSRCFAWTRGAQREAAYYGLSDKDWRAFGSWARRIHTLFNSKPLRVNRKRTAEKVTRLRSMDHAYRFAATMCLLTERHGAEAAERAFADDLWRYVALNFPVKTQDGMNLLHAHTAVQDRVFLRLHEERSRQEV